MWYRWIGVVISFPRKQVNDFTLTKYEEAKGDPTMFADKAATWEVNPQWDPDHPFFKDYPWVVIPDLNVRVPEIYAKHFQRDPVDAQTKYMAQPPPQEDGFFEIPLKLMQAVDHQRSSQVVFTKGTSTRHQALANGEDREMHFVRLDIVSLPLPVPDAKYSMHGDPGLTNDAFAVCVCHDVPGEFIWVVDDEGEQTKAKKIVVDFVLAWEPRPNTPVDLINVQDVMFLLAQTYGIRRVTFDRWNSATSIQWLIDRGIYADDLSFSQAQQLQLYRNLKMLVYNSMLELPNDEDMLNDLLFLRLNGNQVTHDVYGKDRADAVAAAAWEATGRQHSAVQELVAQTLGEYAPGAVPVVFRHNRPAQFLPEIRPLVLPRNGGNGSVWSFSEPCRPVRTRDRLIRQRSSERSPPGRHHTSLN